MPFVLPCHVTAIPKQASDDFVIVPELFWSLRCYCVVGTDCQIHLTGSRSYLAAVTLEWSGLMASLATLSGCDARAKRLINALDSVFGIVLANSVAKTECNP
jgi:hypothetical protein